MASKEEIEQYQEYLKELQKGDPDIIMALEADEENINWLQKLRSKRAQTEEPVEEE